MVGGDGPIAGPSFGNLGSKFMVMPRHSCVGALAVLVALGLLAAGCGDDTAKRQSLAPSQPPAPPPSSPPTAPSVPAAPLPVWKPDPAILDQLAPYQDVEGYEVRAPAIWVARPIESRGLKSIAWRGLERNDGTWPEIWVAVATGSPQSQGEARNATLNTVFDKAMSWLPRVFSNVQCTDKQSGQVNGIPFLKAKVTVHIEAGGGHDLRGILYAGQDGGIIVAVWFFDAQSNYEDTARLGEAAALTFRKRQQGKH
jgi:hypothetical protein